MADHDPDVIREPGCLFCGIVAGTVPARTVLETDAAVAFHDIEPKADVHILVVPKNHRRDVTELAAADPRELADVVDTCRRVAAEHAPEGHFRLIFNTGAEAGQSVFHVHGHVLAGSGPAMSV